MVEVVVTCGNRKAISGGMGTDRPIVNEYKPIGPAALLHMDSYVRTYVVRIMYDT